MKGTPMTTPPPTVTPKPVREMTDSELDYLRLWTRLLIEKHTDSLANLNATAKVAETESERRKQESEMTR